MTDIDSNFKNFAYGTVLTPPVPAASGVSLTVGVGEGTRFPAKPFYATVWAAGQQPLSFNSEILRVDGVAGDVFTIVRAREGTVARAIQAGDQIAATITARSLHRRVICPLVAYNTDASERTVIDVLIPGGLLGATGYVKVDTLMDGIAGAGTLRTRIKLGASTIFDSGAYPTNWPSRRPIMLNFIIANLTAASQVLSGRYHHNANGGHPTTWAVGESDGVTHGDIYYKSAVDTASDQHLIVTTQFSVADAGHALEMSSAIVEIGAS